MNFSRTAPRFSAPTMASGAPTAHTLVRVPRETSGEKQRATHFHPGNAVKMPPAKLRRECMSAPERTVLSTCMQDGVLIGHAFGTVWDYEDGHAAWVTQLVVAEPFRRKYVATQLVEAFKTHPFFRCVSVIGVASSHPATIAIVAKYSSKNRPFWFFSAGC